MARAVLLGNVLSYAVLIFTQKYTWVPAKLSGHPNKNTTGYTVLV